MYNVVISVPKQEIDGTLEQNSNYKTIIGIALQLPSTIPYSFNNAELSNKIMIQRETSEAVDVISALVDYEDVTITVSEVVISE